MIEQFPRVILAALRGGSGKTLLALGLASCLMKEGFKVSPYKKGPDFIDGGWLTLAAGRECHNLDPFLMTDTQIIESFLANSFDADISLIEGNRGLFDSLDLNGDYTTAKLVRLLKAPIILIVDVTMATRTIAALVMGCQHFEQDISISAVILNRVAGSRQESLVRNSIELYCGIPVIGSVPKLKGGLLPERHMGLVPHQERRDAIKAIEWAQKHGSLAVFLMSALVNPLHLPMTIAIAALRYPPHKFFFYCFLGVAVKSLVIAFCGYFGLNSLLHLIGL